jgi:aspartate-semialdehyde dehydrogenase
MSQKKFRVGIVGATGLVGQRFVSLLADHPWFEVVSVAASANSAGKTYREATKGRWALPVPVPANIADLVVVNAADTKSISDLVDFIFCAVDMPKEEVIRMEEDFARLETPVVSNNSANRGMADVPMIMPELNPDHAAVITSQRKRLGTKTGFIAVKPNCSLQSYQPALHALMEFGLKTVSVCTYQAISGAGKTFESWPEMDDNVIPFIKGEEEKSEREPLKIWGKLEDGKIIPATSPVISAQCIRVAVSDGHLAAVSVTFDRKPSTDEIVARWRAFEGKPQKLNLPSAPKPMLTYFEEETRPQTKLDRDIGKGMGIAIGRLRKDVLFDYKFVCLSHNTIRGAAGGAVLTAELLAKDGYLVNKG